MKEQLARDALYEQLVLLRANAGHPSLRKIAEKATAIATTWKSRRRGTRISHESVRQVFTDGSAYDPSWPIVRAVVSSLGGNERLFERLWVAARDEWSRPATLSRCEFPGCAVARDGAQPRGVRGAIQVIDEQGVKVVDFYACTRGHAPGAMAAAVKASES